MISAPRVGDLVHIPQAVDLLDCDMFGESQLTIPLKIEQTKAPALGVIIQLSNEGYLRVYCNGAQWAVKNQSVYKI